MKALRTIGILVLVAVLLLGSVGTVFAKGGPPDGTPGKGFKFQGQQKRGFSGNVTAVYITDGNVTLILTKEGSSVPVRLVEETRYKIPRVMNKWGNLTEFKVEGQLGGDLSALVDRNRRVVTLAGNGTTGEWEALKLMLLPEPGVQGPALHAHRTGLVSKFSYNGGGNITIIDIHGGNHTFVVDDNDTVYHPAGIEAGNITADENLVNSSFVTVVTTGDPKLEPDEKATAKAIVVHHRIPEDWPIPTP